MEEKRITRCEFDEAYRKLYEEMTTMKFGDSLEGKPGLTMMCTFIELLNRELFGARQTAQNMQEEIART